MQRLQTSVHRGNEKDPSDGACTNCENTQGLFWVGFAFAELDFALGRVALGQFGFGLGFVLLRWLLDWVSFGLGQLWAGLAFCWVGFLLNWLLTGWL